MSRLGFLYLLRSEIGVPKSAAAFDTFGFDDLLVSRHEVQSVVAPPNEIFRIVVGGQEQTFDWLLRSYRDAFASTFEVKSRLGWLEVFEGLGPVRVPRQYVAAVRVDETSGYYDRVRRRKPGSETTRCGRRQAWAGDAQQFGGLISMQGDSGVLLMRPRRLQIHAIQRELDLLSLESAVACPHFDACADGSVGPELVELDNRDTSCERRRGMGVMNVPVSAYRYRDSSGPVNASFNYQIML